MNKLFHLLAFAACFLLLNTQLTAQTGNYTAPATAAPSLGTSGSFGNWGTYLGDSAGYNMVSGPFGTFVGHSAGFSLNNDQDNTIVGSFAQYFGTTGIDNVIIGARAGYRNNGSDNTIIGNMAGYHNTTGLDLTFIGEDAGYQNTTGADNVFIGEDAGYNNTTGRDNTFMGASSGRQNTTGYQNTAIGNEALFDLGGSNDTDAHHNTAVGDSAGIDNGEGIFNTFIGAGSGAANEHASFNTFIGARAGYDNNRLNTTTSNNNTYVGYRTGYHIRVGEDNTGMGSRSTATGFASPTNKVRHRTTFFGSNVLVHADDVVALGYNVNARKQFSIAIGSGSNSDGVNAIAIGYQSSVTADNEVRVGNNAIASIGGVVNWTATSDGRMKSEVRENVPGLDFINGLRPVTYQMNMEKEYALRGQEVPDGLHEAIENKKDTRYSGFIAQEVEALAKSVDYDFSGVKVPDNPDEELYGIRYAEFVVPLVKAVQELNAKIDQQNEQLALQASQIETYKKLVAENQQMSKDEKIEIYEAQLGQYAKMLESLTARMNAMEESQNKTYLTSSKDD